MSPNVYLISDRDGFAGWCLRYTPHAVGGMILFMLLVVGGSCQSVNRGTSATTVVQVDGCQYVVYSAYNGVAMVHKGNCPNHEEGK